jgi:hypothetical protein
VSSRRSNSFPSARAEQALEGHHCQPSAILGLSRTFPWSRCLWCRNAARRVSCGSLAAERIRSNAWCVRFLGFLALLARPLHDPPRCRLRLEVGRRAVRLGWRGRHGGHQWRRPVRPGLGRGVSTPSATDVDRDVKYLQGAQSRWERSLLHLACPRGRRAPQDLRELRSSRADEPGVQPLREEQMRRTRRRARPAESTVRSRSRPGIPSSGSASSTTRRTAPKPQGFRPDVLHVRAFAVPLGQTGANWIAGATTPTAL